jgi:hypothetical protein
VASIGSRPQVVRVTRIISDYNAYGLSFVKLALSLSVNGQVEKQKQS